MKLGDGLPVRVVGLVNARVLALRDSPRWGELVRRRITMISYTGRRSGRTFRTPVAFRRRGDVVLIGVAFPEAKQWWRNFLAGGPISLELNGVDRPGHARVLRDARGQVFVVVRLAGEPAYRRIRSARADDLTVSSSPHGRQLSRDGLRPPSTRRPNRKRG